MIKRQFQRGPCMILNFETLVNIMKSFSCRITRKVPRILDNTPPLARWTWLFLFRRKLFISSEVLYFNG